MTVIEEEGDCSKRVSELHGINNPIVLDVVPSRSKPVVMQESVAYGVQTPISKVVHSALAQDFEVLRDRSIRENFLNEDSEQVKEEEDRLLEEVSSYETKKM